jgi:hypothetical protein
MLGDNLLYASLVLWTETFCVQKLEFLFLKSDPISRDEPDLNRFGKDHELGNAYQALLESSGKCAPPCSSLRSMKAPLNESRRVGSPIIYRFLAEPQLFANVPVSRLDFINQCCEGQRLLRFLVVFTA